MSNHHGTEIRPGYCESAVSVAGTRAKIFWWISWQKRVWTNKHNLNEFMCYLIHLGTIQNSIENTFGLTPVKIPHLSIKLSWGSLDELLQGFPLTKPTCIFKASKWIPGIQHAKCLHCHMNVPCFRCWTVSVLFLFAFLPPSLATSSW